jgi:phospholipid/cholesterol/gamma-HCH transport system ATP-binding protein
MTDSTTQPQAHITVRDLTMAYGDFVIQRHLDFSIKHGDVFIIMGGSGCGKSTLLKHLIGLQAPAEGKVFHGDKDFWAAEPEERDRLMRRAGILYQSGALWSSLTLAENVSLPLETYTQLSRHQIREMVALKLALVGLAGFQEFYPSEISGGMRKRAGLARAMAMDPDILFFDEPSAGLDPVSSRLLDDLIVEINRNLGTTVVVVSHELPSIFAIGTHSIFLDVETRTGIASGNPNTLLEKCTNDKVRRFLTRSTAQDLKKQTGETVPDMTCFL